METRRELRILFSVLVVLNALMALGAIGLFGRMGPAIAEIMQENEYSIEAAQSMLIDLHRVKYPKNESTERQIREDFKEQLDRARANVTETPEIDTLNRIERNYKDALAGDVDATQRTVSALANLIEINRKAMFRADGNAQQLGVAGAWAAVLLGGLSFLFALLVFRRLDKRLIDPLEELHEVIEEALHERGFRRCHTASAPRELKQILANTNRLIDRLPTRYERRSRAIGNAQTPPRGD